MRGESRANRQVCHIAEGHGPHPLTVTVTGRDAPGAYG